MFPDVDLPDSLPDPSSAELGKVYLFDFDTKQYVVTDGKPVEATYEQAIVQWVTMLLITELDQYRVYHRTGFGYQFKSFIGRRDLPVGAINSEIKRQIGEKVLIHPQITGISNFEVSREGSKAYFSFIVQTVRGISVPVEREVSIDGRYY